MKEYRVVLSVEGEILVEAERYEWADGLIRFYRADSMIAEYPAGSVMENMIDR